MYGSQTSQTSPLGGNPNTWGPSNQIGSNTNTWGPTPPIGGNPNTWGPSPIGGNPNTWAPTTIGGNSNTWGATETITQTNTVTNVGGYGSGSSVGVTNVQVVAPPPRPKSRSRIEYVPVEQKVIDYQTKEWIETVPRQKTINQYQQRVWTEQVPRQVTRTDHYGVEHRRQYVPEVIATRDVQMIPQERIIQRTDYYPVQRQINHGLQGVSRVSEGQVVGYGQAFGHQVVSMGVTQGQTIITQGAASLPEVIGVFPGHSSLEVGSYGGGYGGGYGQTMTTTTMSNGGFGGVSNVGYGYGTGFAPGGSYVSPMVTSVNPYGTVTQTQTTYTTNFM